MLIPDTNQLKPLVIKWGLEPVYLPNSIDRNILPIHKVDELFRRKEFFKFHKVSLRSITQNENYIAKSYEELISKFKKGASVHLRNLEQLLDASHPLVTFFYNIQTAVGHPGESISCFLSPSRSQALRPHHDQNEIVTIQIVGVKEWRLYNMVYDDRPRTYTEKELGRPSMIIQLKPGDILYVPKGIVHSVSTNDSTSLSLAFVYEPIRFKDIFKMRTLNYFNINQKGINTINSAHISSQEKTFDEYKSQLILSILDYTFQDFQTDFEKIVEKETFSDKHDLLGSIEEYHNIDYFTIETFGLHIPEDNSYIEIKQKEGNNIVIPYMYIDALNYIQNNTIFSPLNLDSDLTSSEINHILKILLEAGIIDKS
ncbi:hypothetical protein AR687_24550 [Flavobacteriaceae bacterium CRH]|nr:hypothetical protein AR687_24550 [Flavobacteriaceae bacterium CRH]